MQRALLVQIYMLKDALTHIAHVLDDIFRDHPVTFLYFVMIAWPLAMNLLQVCFSSSSMAAFATATLRL